MLWLLLLITVVGASCGFALLLSWTISHGRWNRDNTSDHEQIGIKIAATFGLYGIILGFAVVVSQQTYTDAQDSLRAEAGAANTVVEIAQVLPSAEGQPILHSLANFLQADISGWDSIIEPSTEDTGRSPMEAVFFQIQKLSASPADSAAQLSLFTSLSEVSSARTIRFLVAQHSTPVFTWVLLIGGEILVIAMAALLEFDSRRLRYVLLTGMTGLMTLALFTIWALSSPYSGPVQISSEPLAHVLASIELP